MELTSSRASAGLHFIADVLCDGAGALAATSNVLDYLLQRDEELQLLVEQDAFVPYGACRRVLGASDALDTKWCAWSNWTPAGCRVPR